MFCFLFLFFFFYHFRAENKIKHCRIKLEGRLYTIGTVQFESLVELVNYYERHPLYKKIKLSHPVNEDIIRKIELVYSLYFIFLHFIYLILNNFFDI